MSCPTLKTYLCPNLFLSMSELDQTLRTQRLRRGRLSSVKQGGWRGGPPPFGYKLKKQKVGYKTLKPFLT